MESITATLARNYRDFWRVYWWQVAIFSVAVLCDAASTMYFMVRTGPEPELHPVVEMAAVMFGPIVGPLLGAIGKILCGLFLAIYWRRIAFYMFFTASILSFWAAWYNVWGVMTYTPRIFDWIMY